MCRKASQKYANNFNNLLSIVDTFQTKSTLNVDDSTKITLIYHVTGISSVASIYIYIFILRANEVLQVPSPNSITHVTVEISIIKRRYSRIITRRDSCRRSHNFTRRLSKRDCRRTKINRNLANEAEPTIGSWTIKPSNPLELLGKSVPRDILYLRDLTKINKLNYANRLVDGWTAIRRNPHDWSDRSDRINPGNYSVVPRRRLNCSFNLVDSLITYKKSYVSHSDELTWSAWLKLLFNEILPM